MDKKRKLSKSRWVPPTTVQKNMTNTQSMAPRWVPPTTARVNQDNPVTPTFNTSTSRSTTHEKEASRRITLPRGLPSTITYPPPLYGGKDTHLLPSSYMKGCETIEDLIHLAVSHGDLVPKHLAAFWSRIPQLLSAPYPPKLSEHHQQQHQQQQQQLKSDLHRILDDTIEKLGRFGPRDIAGATLGMAKIVKHYNSGSSMRYLSIFQDVIIDQKFNAQLNLFLSMADMSVSIILSQHMEARMKSNIVYAFALIKQNPILHDGTTLLYTLSKYIIEYAGSFDPQGVSNVLWAYATLGETCPRIFETFAELLTSNTKLLNKFEPQHLSITAWSFATVNILHPTLFDLIADTVITCKFDFHSQSTVNLLWAFASIGRVDHHLFSYLLSHVKSLTRDFTCYHLATVAWSYSIANVASPDLDCVFIAAIQKKEHEFNDAELRALHQWQLWQYELGSHTNLSSSLRQRCYDAFIMDRSDPSHLQDDVINELTSIGFKPKTEMVLSSSGYRMDGCIMVHGEVVGIEVDGPYHFTGCTPNGHTILKRRQVQAVDNMKIISVPYWEWEAIASYSNRGKQEYLLCKLSESLGSVITKKMINLSLSVKEEDENDEEEERIWTQQLSKKRSRV